MPSVVAYSSTAGPRIPRTATISKPIVEATHQQ
jgi:hypothetical protein